MGVVQWRRMFDVLLGQRKDRVKVWVRLWGYTYPPFSSLMTISNSTVSPSAKLRNPSDLICVWCTKQSPDLSAGSMNPKPFVVLNHFTVPVTFWPNSRIWNVRKLDAVIRDTNIGSLMVIVVDVIVAYARIWGDSFLGCSLEFQFGSAVFNQNNTFFLAVFWWYLVDSRSKSLVNKGK